MPSVAAPHLDDGGEDSEDGDGASRRCTTLSTVWNSEISAAPPLDVLVGGSIEKEGGGVEGLLVETDSEQNMHTANVFVMFTYFNDHVD